MQNIPLDLADELSAIADRVSFIAGDLASPSNNLQCRKVCRDAATAARSAATNLRGAQRLVDQAIKFEGLPVFVGEIAHTPECWNDGQFRYHCPYCGVHHYHGPPNPGEPSQRTSHCDSDSPLCGKPVLIYLPEKQKPDATNAGPC